MLGISKTYTNFNQQAFLDWFTLATQAYAINMSISSVCVGKDGLDVSIGINTSISKPCILLILELISWLSSLVQELLMLMIMLVLASVVRA